MRAEISTLPPLRIAVSVPTRFRQVVEHLADYPAIIDGDQRISYHELDRWSDDVARLLVDQANAKVRPVALGFPHGTGVIAAILGALKAGIPYTVLDPAVPENRLRTVLGNLEAANILAAPVLRSAFSTYHFAETTVLPAPESWQSEDTAPLKLPSLAPEDVAAIYYTSGTTDRPKGVIWDHAMITHTVWQGEQVYRVQPSDVTALLYSCAYPSSAADVFGALLNGSALAIYRLTEQGVAGLRDWLETQRVTMLHLHASVLHQFLDALSPGHRLEHLRFIRPSGRTSVADIRRLQTHLHPDAICAHWLSSAETLQITQFVVHPDTVLTGEFIPVGYPVESVQITLCDEDGLNVPSGEVGEILVRSRYLARGYWNQPELTAQRFQSDPTDPHYRIYRMGDLARRRPDGMLELLGRNDRRVKIRGYTVDLGAIETALIHLPGVREAIVVPKPAAHDTILIAYIGLDDAAVDCSNTALRTVLAQELPAYMLPARFVLVDALPRQPNGKVDASALPAVGKARPDLAAPFVAPRSDLEQRMADIWADLLELDEVGVEDNFFELGGDSILAMRMALAVEQATGGHVPPEFFRTPTVAHLAALLAQNSESPSTTVTDWSSPTRLSPKRTGSVRSSLRIQTTETGPLWRGHGLPYGLGVRLQRLWVAQPFMRCRYARQLALVERWAEVLGTEGDSEERASISLLANTWVIWRTHVLSRATNLGRWWNVRDPYSALRGGLSSSAGVVLAVPHVAKVGTVLLEVLRRSGCETSKVVGGGWVGQNGRAEMLLQAERVLRRGGVVMVAADGLQGRQSVDVPFWGGRRPWQIGAAELAVTTGAEIVPVYIHMDTKGRIDVEITAPLIPQATTPQAQISELTERYAADYAARWPHFYVSMRWHHLAYNWDRPAW